MHARLAALALTVATAIPTVALADEKPDQSDEPQAWGLVASVDTQPRRRPGPPRSEKEADLDQRLAFLDERINRQRIHAEIWWGGWVSFYGVGTIVQTARAVMADTPADRADLIISVVKSSAAVIRAATDPMHGIKGLEDFPGESKEARVARGERILKGNAKATTPFGPWYAHLINFGINGTGAVIVGAGFDDWQTGLISAGIGFAVGEVVLVTQPWEADKDLEEYESRFGDGRPPPRKAADIKWTVAPSAGGASLNASF